MVSVPDYLWSVDSSVARSLSAPVPFGLFANQSGPLSHVMWCGASRDRPSRGNPTPWMVTSPPQNDAHFFDDARFSTLQPNFILYCCRVDDDARFQVTSSTAR